MPIYEFYCGKCNTIFNFLSKTIAVSRKPACPRCGGKNLERQVSLFAATGNAKEDSAADDLPIDDARMERAVEALAGEAAGINEDDPKQAAALMKKFSAATGLELNAGMKEAMRRLESGEDPEAIEAEMGGMLDGEQDPFIMPGKKGKDRSRKRPPPSRDQKLYEM